MTPPQVKVAIISEAQANALLRQDKADKPCETSGEILNNTGTMEYHQGTRHLSVHFRNMQLKRIKRAEKKGTESVMDEKFCLHFQCQFTVGEKELIFKIWTLSLPVVVIVHGNQEPHAWATVTWDNAFGEPGRMPFQVPERVSWFRVAQALNVKFKSMTGRAINEDGMRFLAEKAFRTPNHGEHLSWSQFCKEPLPDRNFTFWEWFYAVMKLTREHLRGPWVDGSIHGFLGRVQAEELMSTCVCGTFLLRFSDSELGGITIAWVHSDQTVFSLAPFGPKDLSTRSLADRINDIGHLVFLYPDIPKTSAFGKYYTPLQETPPTNKGYVKPQLKTHIPGLGDENIGGMNSPYGAGTSNSSIPGTPHTYYNAQSPDVHNSNDNQLASDPCASFMDLESLEQYAGLNLNLDDIDLTIAIDSYMNSQQPSFPSASTTAVSTTTSGLSSTQNLQQFAGGLLEQFKQEHDSN
jgi:signal transducer and activator of transcription 5B